MKINTLITRIGLLSLAVFTLAGCKKYKDPDFAITGNYFIIQTNLDGGETSFNPYIYMTAAYSNQSIKSLQMNMDGVPLHTKQYGSVFQTENNYINASSLDELNGTYSVSATDPEGKVASLQFTINNNAERKVGALKVTSLKCANGIITATWEKVDNATDVGLMICPKVSISDFQTGYYPFNNYYPQNDTQSSNSCSFNLIGSVYSGYDVEVRVVAANRNNGNLTGMVCVEDDNVRTVPKGQKTFTEGDYEEIVPVPEG